MHRHHGKRYTPAHLRARISYLEQVRICLRHHRSTMRLFLKTNTILYQDSVSTSQSQGHFAFLCCVDLMHCFDDRYSNLLCISKCRPMTFPCAFWYLTDWSTVCAWQAWTSSLSLRSSILTCRSRRLTTYIASGAQVWYRMHMNAHAGCLQLLPSHAEHVLGNCHA